MTEAEHDAKADEAAVAHDPEPKTALPPVFWLTRDRVSGRLVDVVEVWSAQPEMRPFGDGDVMWNAAGAADGDGSDTRWGSWTVAEAKIKARTIPETKFECIRIGRLADVVHIPLLN